MGILHTTSKNYKLLKIKGILELLTTHKCVLSPSVFQMQVFANSWV